MCVRFQNARNALVMATLGAAMCSVRLEFIVKGGREGGREINKGSCNKQANKTITKKERNQLRTKYINKKKEIIK